MSLRVRIDTGSFDAIQRSLSKLDSEEKEVIIIGDTNCDLMSDKDTDTKLTKIFI